MADQPLAYKLSIAYSKAMACFLQGVTVGRTDARRSFTNKYSRISLSETGEDGKVPNR
jgi:hypothetical protein